MTSGFLRRRRSGAQKAVLSTVAAWVIVISAVSTGLIAYLTAATLTGVRETIRTAAPSDRATQVSTRLMVDDPAGQDTTLRTTVDDLMPDVDTAVYRSLAAEPGRLDTDTVSGRGILASFDDIEAHAELVAGAWPADQSGTETALHSVAAESLELAVGDTVTVGDHTYTITGTWLPSDTTDPYWYGDPLETAGIDGTAYGPFVVAESALTIDGAVPLARWRIVPDTATVEPSELSEIGDAVPRLDTALEDSGSFDVRGVVVTTDLSTTVNAVDDAVTRSRSISLVPLVVLAAVGLIAGIQVARLLMAVRREETTLYRSRGATAGQLVRWSAIEAALVVVPAAAAGGLLAAGALRVGLSVAVEPVPIIITAATVAIVGIAVLVVIGAQAANQKVEESVAVASRRASGAIGWSLTLGALIAAAVTVWQLRQYGSSKAAGGADLLATPGPALALLGLAALALAILPVPLSMAERRLARRSGLGGLLPAWEVSRRLPSYAAVVVLVAVTTGAGILAASYAATWTGLQEDLAATRTGTDVRATVDLLGPLNTVRPPTPVDEFAAVSGVTTAAPGNSASARIGDVAATVLALPAAEAESIMTVRPDLFPVNGLADNLVPGGDPDAIALPEGTSAIEVTTVGAVADLILRDPHGALAYIDATDGVAEVPDGFTASSILAVELDGLDAFEPDAAVPPAAVTSMVAVDDAGSRTDIDLAAVAQTWRPVDSESTTGAGPLSLAAPLFDGMPRVRFAPTLEASPVPAVLTRDLLAASGLAVGDSFTSRMFGSQVDMQVAAVADVVPGIDDDSAMMVDLDTVNTAVVAGVGGRPQGVNQIWMGSSSPAATGDAVRAADLDTAQVADRESARDTLVDQGLARQAVFAFWSVAIAAIVLTAIGALASTATATRQRRGELAVLRVVGVAPADQAKARRTEQISMSGVAMVVGAVGGVLLAALTAGVLALAATSGVPGALEPVERWSGPTLGAFAVALIMTVIGVTWSYAARIRREAATALPGSERR